MHQGRPQSVCAPPPTAVRHATRAYRKFLKMKYTFQNFGEMLHSLVIELDSYSMVIYTPFKISQPASEGSSGEFCSFASEIMLGNFSFLNGLRFYVPFK